MYLLGVDVGGTTVKMGLVSTEGSIIDKWEIKTDISENGKNILPDIAQSIKNYLKEKKLTFADIKGIGMGVPGAVKDNFTIICPNIGWQLLRIDTDFKKHLGVDILVKTINDATAAAAGEYWASTDTYESLVMVTLGTGVGGGIIINGNVIEGSSGAGGEIGHIYVDDKHKYPCTCGRFSCLETVASATGIVRLARENLPFYPSSCLNGRHFSAKSVIDAAKNNDKLGLLVLNEVADYLGKALSIIAVSINPEVFVIGGGVSKAGDILTEYITKYFRKYAHIAVKDTKIKIAQLKNDAGILGAAYLVK